MSTTTPWAMRLMTQPAPCGPAAYADVLLDPVTQRARYYDSTGEPVEMGKHGTSRDASTASRSGGGGGDGDAPRPERNDDTTTDHVPD